MAEACDALLLTGLPYFYAGATASGTRNRAGKRSAGDRLLGRNRAQLIAAGL